MSGVRAAASRPPPRHTALPRATKPSRPHAQSAYRLLIAILALSCLVGLLRMPRTLSEWRPQRDFSWSALRAPRLNAYAIGADDSPLSLLKAPYPLAPREVTVHGGIDSNHSPIRSMAVERNGSRDSSVAHRTSSVTMETMPSQLPPLLLLMLPGCEAELLLDQLLVPFLRRSNANQCVGCPLVGTDGVHGLCRVGHSKWRQLCVGADGFMHSEIRVVASAHLGPRHRLRVPPLVLIVLREPLERLIGEFNAAEEVRKQILLTRPSGAMGLANFTTPTQRFINDYRSRSGGFNSVSCAVAAEAPSHCAPPLVTHKDAPSNATTDPRTAAVSAAAAAAASDAASRAWLRRATERVRTSAVLFTHRFEEGKRALCRVLEHLDSPPHATAAVGAGTAAQSAADPKSSLVGFCETLDEQVVYRHATLQRSRRARSKHYNWKAVYSHTSLVVGGNGADLRPVAARVSAELMAMVRAREFADFALYDRAESQASESGAPILLPPRIGNASRTQLLTHARVALGDLNRDGIAGDGELRRRIADSWLSRAGALRRLSPPRLRNLAHAPNATAAREAAHSILFVHVPKCSGTTFRNTLLLEFTRVRRAPADVGCVFYRDVAFRESSRGNSSLVTHGPDCLSANGYVHARFLVITGHIAFHPQLLSRVQVPLSTVTILREPLRRLVSLFNMYPDGTWGGPAPTNSALLNFAYVYRQRFAGRNALTCFVSGDSLCDSIGSLAPESLGEAQVQRAEFHLTHRFAVFGLTGRLAESMALISWTFGWTDFYRQTRAGSGGAPRYAPGSRHRRLDPHELCAQPSLWHEMLQRERWDARLYAFAAKLFAQRVVLVPDGVLPQASRDAAEQERLQCETPTSS